MLEDIQSAIENGTPLYLIEQTFKLKGFELDAICEELGL